MRNPWPMFIVLSITAFFCTLFTPNIIWTIVFLAVVLFIASIILPIKFDDWIAKKINPYIYEYQKEHNIEKFEKELNNLRRFALTKTSKEAIDVNLFSAFLEQGQFKNATEKLEQIKRRAKTSVEHMNYHLLKSEYAKKVGDTELEINEKQLGEELKTKIENTLKNPKQPATAQQCKTAFFCWISFSICLFIGGGIWTYLLRDFEIKFYGVMAIILSWFAFPVALVWFIIWIVKGKKENSASKNGKLI